MVSISCGNRFRRDASPLTDEQGLTEFLCTLTVGQVDQFVTDFDVWTGDGYCDPDTGAMLPTWHHALDQLAADPDARPAHVMRFGSQHDMAGIIAPSPDADRAVRYLVKYLTKAIADPLADRDHPDLAREAHIDRLHDQLRWLPCSPREKTFKVKIAAAVQPVPPEQSGTVPVRPAVSVLRSGVAIGLVLRRRKPLSSDGWDGNRGRTPARSEEPNVVR